MEKNHFFPVIPLKNSNKSNKPKKVLNKYMIKFKQLIFEHESNIEIIDEALFIKYRLDLNIFIENFRVNI